MDLASVTVPLFGSRWPYLFINTLVSVNKLLNGATLMEGEQLKSLNGKYHLDMQTDGNLVLYKQGRGAIWSSGT